MPAAAAASGKGRSMNLTRDIQVAGPRRLGAVPETRHVVARMMSVAQKAGDVPSDRRPIDGDSEILWIDDTASKMAAVAVFFDAGNRRLWLDFLYTDAPLRGRGLGRALLQRLRALAKE